MTQPNDQGGGTPTVAYAYNAAGQPVGEDYGDASMDDVTYAYADSLGRMSGMTDGIGTTAYSYHPVASAGAGSLDQVDGPWANDTVAYLHDTMGRMHRREIRNDDASVSSFVEHDFDLLGRVETTTDNLGVHEVTSFDGDTARPLGLESRLSAAGATVVKRTYAYTDTNSGKRLASIANETGADALLSTFAYSYSPTGQITDWTRNLAGQGTTTWKIDYDPLYQLKDVTVTDGSGTEVDRYAYHYDAAGNRTGEAIGTAGAFASHNVRNQKTQVGGDGTTLIEGTVDEPSSVTVDGEPVAVRALPGGSEYLYQKEVSMTQGPNTFEIVAEDGSGNTENKTYSVEVSGANKILAYDANGNMLSETDQSNGIVKRYEWDAMNRLLSAQSHDPPQAGAQRVEYRYDGLRRRIGRTVKDWSGSAWAVSQDNSYLWCGTELCQKRDSSGGQVVANYSGFGTEKIVAGVSEKRWFTRDHLGSVREVVDETGAVKARYDYDPWGRRTKLEGTEEAEFGFTGHFYDAVADLHLTLFRAYDADLGRWLSADPIGEEGGMNLYGYVGNDPLNSTDSLGLYSINADGSVNNEWGDAAKDIGGRALKGLAAWADGVIPFADPFADAGAYDECDSDYKFGQGVGSLNRDIGLALAVPNLGTWLKNPVMYEVGSTTLTHSTWRAVGSSRSSAIAKGKALTKMNGGGAKGALKTAFGTSWKNTPKTVGSGLTPGASLAGIAGLRAADEMFRDGGCP
ncbi:MAG: RHS repeat-associated core domain-containing protein [Verrucomicrobiales bacterium]